jgi:uroporphyrinogen III methyltransferase/synthase
MPFDPAYRVAGKVYLVGAGPGDPGLLTLKGRQALEESECVVYDRLVNPALLDFAPSGVERIFVGKHCGDAAMAQTEIHNLLISRARAGRVVVRLKGGDPFLFGRGGEEAEALLEAGVAWEVIPGVSSALAVPACAGIPVTHRDLASSLTVVTGHECEGRDASRMRWDKLAGGADTLVFLMCFRNLENITFQLMEHGRTPETPAAAIQWGTCPQQRVLIGNLESISRQVREEGLGPPMVLVVGEVASPARRLQSVPAESLDELLSCVS